MLMGLGQILMVSRAMHETEVRKMDKSVRKSMKHKSNCEEHFWARAHEIQLGREWEPSFWPRDNMSHFWSCARSLQGIFINNMFVLYKASMHEIHLKHPFRQIQSQIED